MLSLFSSLRSFTLQLDKMFCWTVVSKYLISYVFFCSCRRERDHSEAEMSQSLHKISELQEHVQEKERQFAELQEQVSFPVFFVTRSNYATCSYISVPCLKF